MVQPRLIVLALLSSTTLAVGVEVGVARAQPRPDLGSSTTAGPASASTVVLSKSCASGIQKAAQWFVRSLERRQVTGLGGVGWRAWRGTTVDDDQVLPVLWIKIEAIDPSSSSAGAVSGWIEVAGAPEGMQLAPLTDDAVAAAVPDTHWERSVGRYRITRALVDGTPKEQAMVLKALDKCAVELAKPPKKRR